MRITEIFQSVPRFFLVLLSLRLMDELMAVKRGSVAPEVSAERAAKDAEARAVEAEAAATVRVSPWDVKEPRALVVHAQNDGPPVRRPAVPDGKEGRG